MFGFLKSNIMLGVDITATAIKLVELGKNGNKLKINTYGIAPLPEGAVVEHNIHDIDAVSRILAQVIKKSGTTKKQVAAAVAGTAIITKAIEIDASLLDDDVTTQVYLEAEQFIPYPIDEVSIDYELQGKVRGRPDKIKVLVVACRKDNIELREAVLSMAGLKASVVDIVPYAIERTYPLLLEQTRSTEGKKPMIAIADVGATITNLNVIKDEQILYAREQLFDGGQTLEEIQCHYNLSGKEAVLAKNNNTLPEDYCTEMLPAFVKLVVQQISRALHFFYTATLYNDIDYFFVTGDLASIAGLEQMLEKDIGLPVYIANPFAGMKKSPNINGTKLEEDSPMLLVACGLALRSFT